MALSTVRGPEVAPRTADKQSGTKVIPGPTAQAHLHQNIALHEGVRVDSRDNSPDSHLVSRRAAPIAADPATKAHRVPSSSSISDENDSDAAKDAAQPRPPGPIAPVAIKLDACPSFAEQLPSRTKPLWLERHGTLQTVHMMALADPSPASPASNRIPLSWLPSWDIARSPLWLHMETWMLQAQAHALTLPPSPSPASASAATPCHAAHQSHPQPHPHASHPPALASVPESEPASDAPSPAAPPSAASSYSATHASDAPHNAPPPPPAPEQQQQQQPAHSAPASAPQPIPTPRYTPFAARPTQLSLVVSHDSHALPLVAPLTPSLSACIGSLKRSFHVSVRAGSQAPRGLGPVPLPLTPTLLGLGGSFRRRVSLPGAAPADADAAAAAATSAAAAPTAPQQPQPPPPPSPQPTRQQQHNLAFAAGVAAATSTAATVSHGLHAAAAGLAATLDTQAALTSTVLALGANAVTAGTTYCMNRFQSAAIHKSTVAAAEAVLGPSASFSLRTVLRKRLRVTVAGASVLWFLFNLHCMSDTLAHLDFEHDLITSSRVVMNLATSGPALFENCRELLQVGLAIGLGMSQGHTAAAAAEAFLHGHSAGSGSGGAEGGTEVEAGSGSAEAAMEAVPILIQRS